MISLHCSTGQFINNLDLIKFDNFLLNQFINIFIRNSNKTLYIKMGSCLQHFYSTKKLQIQQILEPYQIEARLNPHQTTNNDKNFTYYRNHHTLQQLLDFVLKSDGQSENIQLIKQKITQQQAKLNQYLKDLIDVGSYLFHQIIKIQAMIKQYTQKYKEFNSQQACMVKLELQQITYMAKIDQISISILKKDLINKNYVKHNISIIKIVSQSPLQLKIDLHKHYDVLAGISAQILIQTIPNQSSLTIDISDLLQNIFTLKVFPLKKGIQTMGAISIRAQCITLKDNKTKRLLDFYSLKNYQLMKILTDNSKGWQGLFSESQEQNKQPSITSYYDNPYLA